MFAFNENTLEMQLSRGDTVTLEFQFEGDIPDQNDGVYFTIKKVTGDRSVKIEKKMTQIETDVFQTEINAQDTSNLPFGKYTWDVRVFYGDGQVTTPIRPSPFVVAEVVGNDR